MNRELVALLIILGACAEAPSRPPLSQRARESALAKSGLPGATGIGTALRVSDSATARMRLADSLSKEP